MTNNIPHLVLDWYFDVPNQKLSIDITEDLSYIALEGGREGFTKIFNGESIHITLSAWENSEKHWISDNYSELVGTFQLEVAKRVCELPGSKTYGILSVLVQAFYKAEFLFSLSPNYFSPPPKVNSGVIKLVKKNNINLKCDEALFFKVVKTSFQQRRKTLRNSLKIFNLSDNIKEGVIFGKRPETLSVDEFVLLTNIIANGIIPT